MRALSDHFGGAARRRVVPPNLIIFHNEASIPSGWARFTGPDGRRIIGAGTTYNPGDTGGANSHSLSSETSDSVGAHDDHSQPGTYCSGASTYAGGAISCGAHTHDFTCNLSPEPDYQQLVMIKSQGWLPNFPAKGLLLWDDSGANPSGLTQQYTGSDDKLIRAGASITTGGTTSGACTSTSSGVHCHASGCGCAAFNGSSSGGSMGLLSAGSHDHTTLEYTFNMKRRLLGLWTHATQAFDLQTNLIAMYESTTPPDRWSLCNGTGGTVDMRDFMLAIANQANQGNNTGDDTTDCKSQSISWSHDHNAGSINYGGSCLHSREGSVAHQHTFSLAKGDYFPTYYGLAFIQYTG